MILVIGGNMKKFIEENKKVFEIMISVTLCICAVIAFYSIAQNPQGFFDAVGIYTHVGFFSGFYVYDNPEHGGEHNHACRAACRT